MLDSFSLITIFRTMSINRPPTGHVVGVSISLGTPMADGRMVRVVEQSIVRSSALMQGCDIGGAFCTLSNLTASVSLVGTSLMLLKLRTRVCGNAL